MARYIINNQHLAEDCPELVDELASFYDAKKGVGTLDVYCTCPIGEHRMSFIVEASGSAEALGVIPSGFLRTPTTVSQVDRAYEFATGGG